MIDDLLHRRTPIGIRGRTDLPIAPSTGYENVAKHLDVKRQLVRARTALKIEIRRVFEANFRVYGVHKVWR